jgi:hypothetical protein
MLMIKKPKNLEFEPLHPKNVLLASVVYGISCLFFPKMTHFHYRNFYGLIRKTANSFRKLGLPNFRNHKIVPKFLRFVRLSGIRKFFSVLRWKKSYCVVRFKLKKKRFLDHPNMGLYILIVKCLIHVILVLNQLVGCFLFWLNFFTLLTDKIILFCFLEHLNMMLFTAEILPETGHRNCNWCKLLPV